MTALSVDEALAQLGFRADDLVLSASRSERLPLQGMELTITTPKDIVLVADGQERVVTTTAATAGDLLAEQGIALSETDRTSLYLSQAPAEPHAPAGLPRAGQRGRRDRRGAVRDGSRPPTRTPSRATRRSPPRASTASRSPRYRVTVVDGVETARETLEHDRHPRARHRAGHGRHQGTPGQQPHGRRPELGRAGQVRVRWPRQRRQRATASTTGSTSSPSRTWQSVGGSGLPVAGLAGRADLPCPAALQQGRCGPVAALRPAPLIGRSLSTPPEQPDGLLGPAAIRELAQQLDLRPTKTLGQNFLHDANTIRRIVRTADLRPDDVVLEVGPGLGSLTLGLLPAAARVVAVEIDSAPGRPAAGHRRRPSARPGRPADGGDGRRAAHPGAARARRPTALVANLPYNVAVPVLLNLLELLPTLDRALVLVQAEVAERLAAPPGRLGLRRALGQGRLVRRGAPGRQRRPEGLLARAQRRLRPGLAGPPAAAARATGGPPSPSSTPPSPPGARACAPPSPAGRAARPRPRRGCGPPASTPRPAASSCRSPTSPGSPRPPRCEP